jgi:hypothetical protein
MKLYVINTYRGVEDGAMHSEPWHQVEVECSVPRSVRFRREDAADSHWIAAVAARPLVVICVVLCSVRV